MIKILSSIKLAILLIVVLIVILAISSIKPEILNSLIFLIPLILFFINLTLCTVIRIKREINGEIPFKVGPDIIHLGLLALIIGGFLSILTNKEISKVLAIGDSVQYREYTLRVDSYNYFEYLDGRPKDWVTTISIYKDASLVKTRKIEVGKPLRFKGLTTYQISFSDMGTGLLFKMDRSYYLKLISFLLIFLGVFITYIQKIKEIK